MKKFKIILLTGMALIFSFCSLKMPNESDFPTWNLNLDVPLLNQTITIDDLLTDSLITKIPYGTAGDSIFAFEDEIDIDEVRVGNQLNIDDINQSIQQGVDDVTIAENQEEHSSAFDEVGVDPVTNAVNNTIGDISLDDTDIEATDPIKFSDIITLSVPEGNSAPIAQSTAFTQIDRQITFDDFDQANFKDGILEVSIQNDLVIELGAPVYVRLLDASLNPIVGTDSDTAKAVWLQGITSGNSSVQTINLDNKNLPGTITVRVSGVVCGSGATTVTNNAATRNSSFVVNVQARDLIVSSALAIIPEQTIDTTSTITLDADEPNKVQKAVIKDGHLKVSVTNQLSVRANLELTVSSLKTVSGGSQQTFVKTIPLTANQTTNQEYSLTDNILEMDLTSPGIAQEVDYSYVIRTIPTDPDKVTIASTDLVDVDIDMYGATPASEITFKEILGIVEPQNIVDNGEINTDSDAEIRNAQIASGEMTLVIDNRINKSSGGIPHLVLDFPELFTPSSAPLTIESDMPAGQTTISYPLTNCSIRPLSQSVSADSVRQYITYNSLVTTPSGELAEYNLMDSIDIDINISEMIFSSVTGLFNQDAIVTKDTITLEENTKISTAQIANGNLVMTFVNNMGVIADVKLTINEIKHRTTNSPLVHIVRLPSGSQPKIETIPLDDYNIVLPFTDLNTNQEIHYTSRVSIPSDEEMTITFDRKIDVDVHLTEMEFASVNGYIDTVEVDIGTSENEVNAFPEEFSGINLQTVEMVIDFETNIGVPVELNLFIKSYNEQGDTVRREVHQVITDNPRVIIPQAEELINIKPKNIVTSGYALVGGTGQVDTMQYVRGVMSISVPMEMEVTEGAKMEFEPEIVEDENLEIIESATLYADIENDLEIGGDLILLAARDTLFFEDGSIDKPDTLAIIRIHPDSTFLEIVELGEEQMALFEDSVYVKTQFNLKGRTDNDGNPIPSRFMTGDEMKMLLYGTIKGLVDFADKDEE
ncbi:MAG: hypothetical protein PHN44_04670 [Candidatus Marinimicrobia bacterium]|nr:hypothetical protein [Candidatus Neomarinimicrobiota bacterium]MDD5539689.1 hypothetical protein [Candidatus Neomarinimicrobiota bacterium]